MNNMNFLKGVGVGLVAGSVIGMMTAPKKRGKSVVGRCLKGMGEIIENMSDVMGV